MSVVLLLSVALAGPPLSIDLDGDGKPESVAVGEEWVQVGPHRIECGYESLCTVEAHDISSTDKQHELAVCEPPMRDTQSCRLYALTGGQLRELSFGREYPPEKIVTSGTGIVLTEEWTQRLYRRIEKYTWDGTSLKRANQPYYAVGATVHVDRLLPVYSAAGGGETVANVKPDSDVVALIEDPAHQGWFLLKLSSGITGWVDVSKLIEASDQLTLVWSAG